ncbi:hypothetical protein CHU98_g2744 [Xylaria longipes]|nr:hypothetical protein CHU98_g2744 [Xylaria longipes]
MEEQGFISSRLDNLDWVTDCLVPALIARSSRHLITYVVKRLLQNKPETTQPKVISAATKVLQTTYKFGPAKGIRGRDQMFHTPSGAIVTGLWASASGLHTTVIHIPDPSIYVSKPQGKEFEEDLQEYNREVAEFERPFLALRHEYMKGLLGDAVYRELVMLEGVRDSEGAKQLASAAVTGTKRGADETLENQTTVKPRQD